MTELNKAVKLLIRQWFNPILRLQGGSFFCLNEALFPFYRVWFCMTSHPLNRYCRCCGCIFHCILMKVSSIIHLQRSTYWVCRVWMNRRRCCPWLQTQVRIWRSLWNGSSNAQSSFPQELWTSSRDRWSSGALAPWPVQGTVWSWPCEPWSHRSVKSACPLYPWKGFL